jgi:cytokinin trans-hydroxylase
MVAVGVIIGLVAGILLLPKLVVWLLVTFEPSWKKNIPGPYPNSLLLGGLAVLANRKRGDPFSEFSKLQKQFGDMVLLRRGLFTPDVVLVADPKYVTEALAFDRKGAMYDSLRIVNDNDLFFSDGAYWHKQRKLMNPMFSTTAIKGMYNLMVDELKDLKAYLNEQNLRESININDTLQKVALDVLTAAAFGINFGALRGANSDAIQAMSDLLLEAERRSLNPIGHRLNPFALFRLRRLKKTVVDLAHKCLNMRLNDAQNLAEKNDLLNLMIKAEDAETGTKMTQHELISEIIIFLVAGHETTAHSMTWFLLHTAQHLDWQKKLQEEVDTVLQSKDYPSYDDLSQMTVLDMIVKESMRLMSVAPGGSVREATKDIQFGEYFIPKGTAVWVPLHNLNYNEHAWSEPEKFDPTRFANNQSHYPKFLPFSAGPRNCIGQTFAKVEMRAVLSTMAKYFSWKLDETKEVIPTYAVTQKPEHGLFVFLTPRD